MSVDIIDVVGNPVAQVCVFGLCPYELNGIELGRICRKPSRLKPLAVLGKLIGCCAMGIETVPDDEQGATEMAAKYVDDCTKSSAWQL